MVPRKKSVSQFTSHTAAPSNIIGRRRRHHRISPQHTSPATPTKLRSCRFSALRRGCSLHHELLRLSELRLSPSDTSPTPPRNAMSRTRTRTRLVTHRTPHPLPPGRRRSRALSPLSLRTREFPRCLSILPPGSQSPPGSATDELMVGPPVPTPRLPNTPTFARKVIFSMPPLFPVPLSSSSLELSASTSRPSPPLSPETGTEGSGGWIGMCSLGDTDGRTL
jgi:hypothetical protein